MSFKMKKTSEIEIGVSHKLVLDLTTGEIWFEPRSRTKKTILHRFVSAIEYIFLPDISDIKQEINIFSIDHENIKNFLRLAKTIEENYNRTKAQYSKPSIK